MNIIRIDGMRRLFVLICVALICGAAGAQNATWKLVSEKKTAWNPMNPAVPIRMEVTPADSSTCDVTAVDMSSFTKFAGEMWTDSGDEVRLKLKGKAANGVSVMIYGTVESNNNGELIVPATLSADMNGRGTEQKIYLLLKRGTTAEEQRQQEEEARRRAAEEEAFADSAVAPFVELWHAQRIGAKRRKLSWGSVMSATASGSLSGAANSVGNSVQIEPLEADGEAKTGTFSAKGIDIVLKDKRQISVPFVRTAHKKMDEPKVEITAHCSEGLKSIVYDTVYHGVRNAFLLHDGRLYKLDKIQNRH